VGEKMITNVEIKNFKSIRDQTLENLPPIVGIWGKNGVGKSSFLQAIVWAGRNLGGLNGNGLQFRSAENIVHGQNLNEKCLVLLKGTFENVEVWIEKGQVSHRGRAVEKIRYFPPWRYISVRGGGIQNKVERDLGIQAQNTHNYIHWFLHELIGKIARDDEDANTTYKNINHWAEKIGYGKILDSLVEMNYVEGIYRDPIFDIEIPIVDGGFGGNSFLPIILECYKFKEGIILIEEPEISLHPGAQGDIWEFMMEMVEKQNHQIIFTSHSPYLVRKLARTLSEGKFKNEIHVYYTSKTEKKGTEFELIPSEEIINRFSEYWGDDIFPELRER
jgi:predicted ATPase